VQIYDPQTGTFTLADRMPTPRIGHSAVLLDDGDVLIMGGQKAGGFELTGVAGPFPRTPLAPSDNLRWDHETGELTPAGAMTRWRTGFLATGLEDGRVLMIGHQPWDLSVEPFPIPSDEELQTVWSAEVFR
jgi:hypothetical protein